MLKIITVGILEEVVVDGGRVEVWFSMRAPAAMKQERGFMVNLQHACKFSSGPLNFKTIYCFLTPSLRAAAKPFAPIKELLSEENPAIYREFTVWEYYEHFKTKGRHVGSALPHFKIR
ncbi:1-aminocyclopropane-1-carboxylate oxidase7 [Sesamum alatum]|uniref:1-aminocyclopropane-1-carboxylate oxidase7 n=1 Tax=Sesamum alatum TaxID=300844 RepID=A0AAE1XVJ6_9LAMI|nr:1-aminocyclopropane-1-carboxylate oxidase7 [Sesamum alatum]